MIIVFDFADAVREYAPQAVAKAVLDSANRTTAVATLLDGKGREP